MNYPDLESARSAWKNIVENLETDTLREQRWFQGRTAGKVRVDAADFTFLSWPYPRELVSLNIIRAYVDGQSQDYFLPLILREKKPAQPFLTALSIDDRPYVVTECSLSRCVQAELYSLMSRGAVLPGLNGCFVFHPVLSGTIRAVRSLTGNSSNSALHLQRDVVLKLTRRLWPGLSREIEIESRTGKLSLIPEIKGYLTYEMSRREKDDLLYTLAIWQDYLPNQGSLWDVLVAGLSSIMASALTGQATQTGHVLPEFIQRIAPEIDRLASVTARLHLTLARMEEPSAFSPQDLGPIMDRIHTYLTQLEKKIEFNPPDLLSQAAELAAYLSGKLSAAERMGSKIQTHGDLHLGQILVTDEGYVVLDLEGEPLLEPKRRASRTTPLRDLAGLVRSFSYAGQAAYLNLLAGQAILLRQKDLLRSLATRFAERSARQLIDRYYEETTRLTPELAPDETWVFVDLMDLCRLEKVLYELSYELVHRPDWVLIPQTGLCELLAQRVHD